MESCTLVTLDEPPKEINIKRTSDNQRKRSNGGGKNRHDPFSSHFVQRLSTTLDNSVSFLHFTELEWLSLNWRKYRAAQMSLSTRRMILYMFEHDYQYFPTLREIKDSLTRAEMRELKRIKEMYTNQTKFELMMYTYREKWDYLFKIADLGDMDKPLTPKILGNPNHKITMHLLYIYSMESFIFANLNQACREKE